ncbi:DUF4392 domain-containing protein [Clostridium formicaceticum]|uniref:D-glutamate cyclase-like C-terminal domain-containing protein n=1 Tax=Clostridium formicaceticum TaxID=1497 RepID=A0AAC9RIX8_9CLOT|nr:DUF4392 domain-containing protein [Clostridium formicaceticum]AOY76497.1 hypothetical protein BJL90_11890 [Clostridium formicaceticum]ARE86906.1 hypothetical protein CLFO_12900 [Clostridium formicaceticum]
MKQTYIDAIEAIIGADMGCRGLGADVKTGDLWPALKELSQAKRIILLTGFCIKDTMTGETDGPIGAVSLAAALIELGKEVLIITDDYSYNLVTACCQAMNIQVNISLAPLQETASYCKKTMKDYAPDLVVAIERPGRAEDGGCYSMRGEDLSSFVPNTDPLFSIAKESGIKTIAIGDGGNEIGMGKIAQHIKQNIKLGEKICAVSASDYLIIAGVSNWGGHGMVAGLSIMNAKMLLHDVDKEIAMLEGMIREGGVDGCSKNPVCTVDGLSLEINLSILEKLRETVLEALLDQPVLAIG